MTTNDPLFTEILKQETTLRQLKEQLYQLNHLSFTEALNLLQHLPDGSYIKNNKKGLEKHGAIITEHYLTPDWEYGPGTKLRSKEYSLNEFAQRIIFAHSRDNLAWIKDLVGQYIYPQGEAVFQKQQAELTVKIKQLSDIIDQLWRKKHQALIEELSKFDTISIRYADSLGVHIFLSVDCGGDDKMYWENWLFDGEVYHCEYSPNVSKIDTIVEAV
ncbi:MAG: hypothetical protein WCV88_04515 [Patescibacteria group bacterium]